MYHYLQINLVFCLFVPSYVCFFDLLLTLSTGMPYVSSKIQLLATKKSDQDPDPDPDGSVADPHSFHPAPDPAF
jgi:hypothetical protein